MKKQSCYFWKIFFLLNITSTLFCAGPLTHIYLAQQWLTITKKYDAIQSALFICGTLFPDIRYYASLDRQKTHESGVTMTTVFQESDAFKAGMQFHAWVDDFRIKNAEPQGLVLVGKSSGAHSRTFLKLVEDEIIYDALDHEYLALLLTTIPQEEHAIAAHLEISPEVLIKWHHHLIYHVKTRPVDIIATQANDQKDYLITITSEIVQVWNTLLPLYSASDTFKKYVYEMIDCFITTLKVYNETEDSLYVGEVRKR